MYSVSNGDLACSVGLRAARTSSVGIVVCYIPATDRLALLFAVPNAEAPMKVGSRLSPKAAGLKGNF